MNEERGAWGAGKGATCMIIGSLWSGLPVT
jgi:hypothetical protein